MSPHARRKAKTMTTTWRIIGIMATGVALASCGCARKPVGQERAPALQTKKPTVLLPEWAPQNPSPEFLRAARVLKPMPEEVLGARAGDPAKRASAERTMRIMPAAWEFFGSLAEAQIKTFQAKREVRLPVKSLTAKQRAAFDHWLEVYRETNRGQRPPEFKDHEDLLVLIYKSGAKQDLSNVEVGFSAPEGHVVYANFWIRQPDGTLAHMSVGSLAQI